MSIVERDMMSGLAKGLAVIETFSADRPRQSIADVSAASGLDRATARRCLLTLVHQGYSEWDGKYFTLTPRVLRLGTACLVAMPLPHLLQPFLDALSDETGESSSASILDGEEIVYIARAAKQKVMSIALMPGSRLPAHCSSMGRVLLASLPEDEARHLLRTAPLSARTPLTVTDPEALMQRLAEVRDAGHAINDQEIEMGLRSIAVPLRTTRGKVVAALNIGLSASRASVEDLRREYLPALLKVQEELRRALR
jgi:IclR family pca regulon transcriptional regulator